MTFFFNGKLTRVDGQFVKRESKVRVKVSTLRVDLFATIRITCPCDLNPLAPHFYIVKLGFTGVYFIILFLLLNIDCVYSLEPSHLDGSNMYLQSMF